MHTGEFLTEAVKICKSIDARKIEQLATELAALRERGGRLFILGAGGSAGNASHAVNDFRKLCHIECYAPTDNVAELTARTNDEGWESVFAGWLEVSRFCAADALLIFSVGGGDADRQVSVNLIRAIDMARERHARVFGVVGRDNGYTAQMGDVVVVIPQPAPDWVTPLSEAFQAVVWHCLVSHPILQRHTTKW
jgi:D-sedoheptulose 7-phosphate isomerase